MDSLYGLRSSVCNLYGWTSSFLRAPGQRRRSFFKRLAIAEKFGKEISLKRSLRPCKSRASVEGDSSDSTTRFKATTSACCGIGGKYNYDYAVQCGISGMIHGKSVKAESCSDPASYSNWDGVHWTDQANRLLTQQILGDKFFEPSSFSISRTCQLQPI